MTDRFAAVCDLLVPMVRENSGLHQYDGVVQDLSPDGVRTALNRLGRGSSPGDGAHDLAHLEAFEQGLRVLFGQLEMHRRDPYLHLANLELTNYHRDYAPAPDRAAARARHLAGWPDAVEMAVTSLDQVSAPTARALLPSARRLAADVRDDDGDAGTAALRAHGRLVGHLERVAATGDPKAAIGGPALAKLMGASEAIELDLGQLTRDATAERIRLTELLGQACAAIHPDRPTAEVVEAVRADHPGAGTLTTETMAYANEALAFTAEHSLVPYLDGRLEVGPTVPSRRWTKASLSWAAPNEADGTTWFRVTPPEPDWPAEQRAQWLTQFNRASLPAIVVHEVAPGHFVHSRALRRLASPVRRGLQSMTFLEGWAHYGEELCVELGFRAGDPRFAVGVVIEALVRVTRLTCAIGLHTGAMTVEEATELFVADAHLSHAGAAAEARRGTFDATYGRYTVGKLAVQRLRQRAEQRWGPAFSLPRFHTALLSLGAPPLGLLDAALDEAATSDAWV